MEKVLALSAHIDDVEIAMGGTLLKHRDRKDKIIIGVMRADDDLAGDPRTREEEQYKTAELLGADIVLLRGKASIDDKVGILDDINPTVLYFPFEQDTHQDHNVVSQIGFAVSRRNRFTVMRYIGTTSHSYSPNFLQIINMEEKKNLVSLLASQIDRRPKFTEIMEAQNRFFGSLIPGNGHFAEGFVLYRMVMN